MVADPLLADLLAARLQMALSLGFHIVFACVGMAMPFFMAVAHYRYIRTGKTVYRDLTRAWSRGVAIFFATGAVSGTVLSFELGLLWPGFMQKAGSVIGMPFSWEGSAFFLEAIALGIFLYGWDRLKPWVHWASGLVVGISGVLSGVFVVCANAWMNNPAGFTFIPGDTGGQFTDIDPFAAMFNPGWKVMALHMVLAAFVSTGFAVAGVHAWLLRREPGNVFHREALRIALAFGAVAALLQPLSGDLSAKHTAKHQPVKLAAMEAHFHTSTHAPLYVGGWPDSEKGTVSYALPLPGLLSFLAFGDVKAEVKGLHDFPREEWPPALIVHLAFQVMVGLGTWLAALGLLTLFFGWKRPHLLSHPFLLLALVVSTPLGFIALEAGWIVTEVGRQPWIIQGIMKTRDALTPMPGLWVPFSIYALVYLILAAIVTGLMIRHIRTLKTHYPSAREVETEAAR